ncbi:1-acyl-sn-glycerol-3-phosphate acyltransferase [Streptomyces griseoaurantiacus]|uniref:1-acylglycerol-3-phosphate O-acyltransferase n=2 Tax=Streptomyces griseoaurantiacus TaxID=68213 RepID=F3NLQ8_9ACTN|nr:1-acylglycerol-3-phosphate O-acyltransferase [Streptomyces griseoaurantiacus M045]MCF0090699.1 1-acyl-sn-glycerol-3-phosphate acyltransferase [Streptomyces sp. MH192]MCF0103167.1 1-acyl-sn-glycerol-3-phosphate acyltransferase [Streptomyces sp. MH191]GHE69884.1 1-acyl-sn-glycerol-3-phosphate acyltransferase [Streptomyces griseoaurantiacus]SDE96163.1 1-acyl-sn-glycerol-3-phosphate acyltransferase [Streptomyces jietaisiensis]
MSRPSKPEAGPPSERGAEVGRRIGVGLMYGLWKPRVLGAWRVPATGPLILAVNHTHNVDGPMVMGVAPRPTHFLIKKEAFIGPLDPFLTGIGQVKVDRHGVDRTAISRALAVLDQGGVLGIFPEGTRGEGDFASLRAGLAYFAVRGGAPVLPVAVLGSSERRGRLMKGLPPLRSRVDVVFGDPFDAGDGSGRRTRAALDEATLRIQKQLTAHLENARRLTGR